MAAPCVVVDVMDGSQLTATKVFSRDDLAGDYPTQGYVVRYGDGRTVTPDETPATTLLSLVQATRPGLTGVDFVDVRDSDGARHVLRRGELGGSGFDGDRPPVVIATGGDALLYQRTVRDDSDVNGSPGFDWGYFTAPTLHVVAHLDSEQLFPEIVSEAHDPKQPGKVSFAVDHADPDLTYEWTFGDRDQPGTDTSTDAVPVHDYGPNAAGLPYPVTVEVERASDGAYGQDRTTITVGTAPTESATPTDSSSPTDTSSGGASTPTKDPSDDPTDQTTRRLSTKAPTAVGPTGPTTGTTTGSATGSATATAGATTTGAVPAGPSVSPSPSFVPPQDPAPPGSVTGIVLQAFEQGPAAGAAGAVDDRVLTDDAKADDRSRIDPRLWLVLAVLALSAAGAASEARGVHAWVRRHRPWSRLSS